MKTRIITSIVGLAVLALVLALFDTVVFELVITAISLIAIHEVFAALGFGKKDWYLYAAMVPYTFLVMLSNREAVRVIFLPASFLLMLFYCICTVAQHCTLSFEKLSAMLLFSGIVLMCFYSLVYLKRVLPVSEYNYEACYFILLILCFAWGGDTAAYFVGRLWGKRKLAPIVSPKKTVEGAIGGIGGSILLGVLLTLAFQSISSRSGIFTHVVAGRYYVMIVLLGAVASVLGILGDLFASVIKRQHEIKDYGTIFPGHGGILDRFDSVMFIAPFVTIVVRFAFYTMV